MEETLLYEDQPGTTHGSPSVAERQLSHARRHSSTRVTSSSPRSETLISNGRVSIDRETLYAELEPLVRRLIRRFGNTPELRRDLAGEIYYRFCTFFDAFEPERGIPLRPYLVRQLTAATYTYVRHHWRTLYREVAIDEYKSDYGFGWEEDPTVRWDQTLAEQEVAGLLPEAIGMLPRRQRQVVIWRYYEERSFEEIAEMLGVQNATARSLLRHGLNGIRKHIGTQDCAESKK